MPYYWAMLSSLQVVLATKMPRDGIWDYALKQLAQYWGVADKSVVHSLSLSAFHEKACYYSRLGHNHTWQRRNQSG